MPRTLFLIFALSFSCVACSLGSVRVLNGENISFFGPASTDVIITDPVLPGDSVAIKKPPSFAIAGYGYRHDLGATYSPLFIPMSPHYEYLYTLESGASGMTISPDGIVKFLPSASQSGNTYTVSVNVTVLDEGSAVFSDTVSFTTTVIPEAPKLELTAVSGLDFGKYGRTKYGYDLNLDLTDEDRDLFRFSLIDPPPGVYLSENGSLMYRTSEFAEGITAIPIHLKYELETLSGIVSDEIEFVQELLPEPPPSGILDTWDEVGSGLGAWFGFSVASDGSWLIVGEPFNGDASPTAPTGRAHLWSINPATGALQKTAVLSPSSGTPGEAFGGSVAVSDFYPSLPSSAVVGVPEAPGGADGLQPNVGRVEVFEKVGTWQAVASLSPPEAAANLYVGGWVDVYGDTIIASAEGADSQGPFTGALTVYRRSAENGTWEWTQTLTAPDAEQMDYFGYPCSISGDWVAAAANEDDEAGDNAGAVHLFERVAGSFVHRQKILSPSPQPGALFGERLELKGEWLFVSAFRQDTNTGAVYVYRLVDGTWEYQQRLAAPFVTAYSGFGSALAVRDATLCVSAPGYLAGENDYPWMGLTLYRLVGDTWVWANQLPGSNFTRSEGMGFALAQITDNHTLAAIPFENLNQGRAQGGRIIRFDWPVPSPETFEDALASEQLPSETSREGDEDHNGLPNLLQWAMGQDIGQTEWSWAGGSTVGRPFVEKDGGRIRLVFPPITRGWDLDTDVLISTDGTNWTEAAGVQWEQVRTYQFRIDDLVIGSLPGTSSSTTYNVPMQPVTVPWPEDSDVVLMRLRCR